MASETHTPPNGELWTTLKVSELESLRAALAEAERRAMVGDSYAATLHTEIEAEEAKNAALRSELARKDAALRDIAIAPCLFELLGGGEECEDSCPGCRARAALASPTAEGTT